MAKTFKKIFGYLFLIFLGVQIVRVVSMHTGSVPFLVVIGVSMVSVGAATVIAGLVALVIGWINE